MRLIHKKSDDILAENVEVADSFWKRFRGLMLRKNFEKGDALLFKFPEERKFGIHTFFLFFYIDLIYLDEDLKVLEIKKDLPPFRFYNPEKKAHKLVELRGGTLENKNIEEGEKLKIIK